LQARAAVRRPNCQARYLDLAHPCIPPNATSWPRKAAIHGSMIS